MKIYITGHEGPVKLAAHRLIGLCPTRVTLTEWFVRLWDDAFAEWKLNYYLDSSFKSRAAYLQSIFVEVNEA